VKRKRTLRQQAISGLRIASLVLMGIAAFAGLVVGFNLILDEGTGWSYRAIGAVLASTLTVLIYATVRHWAHWLFGIAGYSTLRLALPALYTAFVSQPSDGAPTFVWFLYALASALLTLKYVRYRPKLIEKVGLVAFVLGIACSTALPSVGPMIIGLVFLGVGEVTVWLSRKHRNRTCGSGSPGSDIEPLSLSK
jgi:hypothetical protein